MLCIAMKRSPAKAHGRLDSTPVAIVAGAIRRAWARIVERIDGESRLLKHAAIYSDDLDNLLVQHAVRHGRNQDGSHRIFRPPDLVYDPPVRMQSVRESRPAAGSVASASKAWHDSS
jgi:hypothetical protein